MVWPNNTKLESLAKVSLFRIFFVTLSSDISIYPLLQGFEPYWGSEEMKKRQTQSERNTEKLRLGGLGS